MLKIDNITKVYHDLNSPLDDKVVLEDFNLTIEDGEFVTIIGGNGSGKTTLMNSICGAVPIDSGRIILGDKDITHLNESQRANYIGRVFQDPKLGTCDNMSIIENMMLAYRRDKKKTLRWGFKKELSQKFKTEVQSLNLGLEDKMEKKVGSLSGGQRQALTLLMATLSKPSILLLDEHTAALDPKTQKNVLELTNKIVRENNLTTLMITHNMSDAVEYGDRLIMIKNGKIIFDVKGEDKKNLTRASLLEKFDVEDDTHLVL